VLIGLVAFVLFVLWRLWGNYQKLTQGEPTGADPMGQRWKARGGARTMYFVRGLGRPLLLHLGAAALATGALFVLYRWLPLGAQRQAAALAHTHETQLEASLLRFDFARVRYHASQLEYLAPDKSSEYQAVAAKGELLRHLLARPTLWASDAGIAEITTRMQTVRRLLGRRPDPDLLVIEAMVLWHRGDSRQQEWQAASLCARALRLRPRGFALAPLARAYVEIFLHAPNVPSAPQLGRDAEVLADLRTLLEAPPPADDANHPLAASLLLLRLMREVDGAAADAYAAMASAQAEVARLARDRAPAADREAARRARTEQAGKVIEAWKRFDRALVEAPALAADPVVLSVFRLDDALYVRAKWYADHPAADAVAPVLADLKGPARLDDRLGLAPPRVVWARRYRGLLEGPARELVELQEAERFQTRERAARAFEAAMSHDKGAGPIAPAAAQLGLYVTLPSGERRPLLLQLAPESREATLLQSLDSRGLRLL
jgi:hypothetical protein